MVAWNPSTPRIAPPPKVPDYEKYRRDFLDACVATARAYVEPEAECLAAWEEAAAWHRVALAAPRPCPIPLIDAIRALRFVRRLRSHR